MIDFSVFVDFYFAKYLFMVSAFFGVFQCIKKLLRG